MSDTAQSDNVELKNGGAQPDQELGPDGKVVKKTFQEIREEARRAILPGHDREKYETLPADDQEFVNAACLFEFNQQQVQKTRRKVKLRDILLCRDVAAAYCSGRDLTGQYSEGKRILKNSESGSETVKFVLARKICSMIERISNLYSSHPRNYVSADVHRTETELLNYTGRLGKIIKNPLGEARRIYLKLKERTGWEIPKTAFENTEGCDVPQMFFNRYSDPNQLLLKDPMKPFRSDNVSPPLNLDFRIKNAVLIMAGENRFFVDKKKFAAVRETSAVRAIELKAVTEARNKIRDEYNKNTHELAEKLVIDDDFNVRSIKEAAFAFFYGYTLKSLPNTAARADGCELMIQQLMAEENDIGCSGFCRWLFPPRACDDDTEPNNWSPAITAAYSVRSIFHGIGTGEVRLAMFATRMSELLTKYLDEELNRALKESARPFEAKFRQLQARREAFKREHIQDFESLAGANARLEELSEKRESVAGEAFSLVAAMFNKPPQANSADEKIAELERLRPRLEQEHARRGEQAETLKNKYTALAARNNNLIAQVKHIDELRAKIKQNPGDGQLQAQVSETIARVAAMISSEKQPAGLDELRAQAMAKLQQIHAALGKLKSQHAQASGLGKKLTRIVESLGELESIATELEEANQRLSELGALPDQLAEIQREMDAVANEREETVGRIEEMLEVNKET